jgi:hypothetical protein
VRAEQGSKKPRIQRLQLYMYDHRDVELKNQVMEVTLIKNFLRRKSVARWKVLLMNQPDLLFRCPLPQWSETKSASLIRHPTARRVAR